MSLKVKFTPTLFILPPEGMHIARCYSVIDLGEQESKTYNNRYPAVRIAWELPQTQMADGKPFMASRTYNVLLRPKTKLFSLLEGWRGKAFTPEEVAYYQQEAFDFKALLGLPCYLTIHYDYDPQHPDPWATVTHASPLPTGVVCPPLINPPVYYDLDEHTEAAYSALPESIRQKINSPNISSSSPTTPLNEAKAASGTPTEPPATQVNPSF